MTSKAAQLRRLLAGAGPVMAPGACDTMQAKLIEEAGFSAMYITGGGSGFNFPGVPDLGIKSLFEAALMVKTISRSVDIPVIADGDSGFGTVLNVIQLVQAYEEAGAAGVHIEDQDQSQVRRCGHLTDKRVISADEMCVKVRAASDARTDKDFLIIARTDALAVTGFDDTVRRARMYVEAGADVIFYEAPTSVEMMQRLAGTVPVPLMANMAEGGKTPLLHVDELNRIGYKLIIYPLSPCLAAMYAVRQVLAELKTAGTTEAMLPKMANFDDWCQVVGFPKWLAILEKYQ